MFIKTLSFSCPECGIEYTVSSANWESIQYCPFCGETGTSPYEADDEDPDDLDPFQDPDDES